MSKEKNNEIQKASVSFENLTLEELVQYEKISSIVCKKYENSCKAYDGSISKGAEYAIFLKYNNFHENLITEMCRRIDEYIK